ncbi:hypothetical protein KM043_007734 [Ampulex compressa]|nr:hypothetical protein KM043_007734 [Ampulex compressa]
MSPRKRRAQELNTFNESNRFKPRRSSLRVNLSYASNATNSNNGSVKTRSMQKNAVRKRRSDTDQSSKERTLQENESISIKSKLNRSFENRQNKQILTDNTLVYKGIYLKNISVVIQDIGDKEQALNINCTRLKNAILNKTKQIFDRQNEFSMKTAAVLKAKDNSTKNKFNLQSIVSTTAINGKFTCSATTENKVQENYANAIPPEKHPLQNKKNCKNVSTSNLLKGEKAVDESKNKSTPLKEHFFSNTEATIEAAKKINNDTARNNFSPTRSVNINKINSPIITGSTKTLGALIRPSSRQSKLFSQHRNEILRTPNPTILEDVNVSLCVPICCSTMIEENMLEKTNDKKDAEDDPMPDRITSMNKITKASDTALLNNSKNRVSKDKDVQPNKIDTSIMKISKSNSNAQASVSASRQTNDLLKNNSKSVEYSDLNHHSGNACQTNKSIYSNTPISMELTMIQKHILLQETANTMQKCDKIQRSRQTMSDAVDDSRTIRSSLDVNTSIDMINDVNEDDKQEPEYNIKKNQVNDIMPLIANEDIRESVNTVRTSLQMNTSLDALNMPSSTTDKNLNEQNDHENSQNKNSTQRSKKEDANDFDILERTSLIDRLNNVPTVRNNKCISEASKERQHPGNSMTNTGNESYVQATPYPTDRSFLKTYLKHITTMQNACTDKSTLLQSTSTESKLKDKLKNQETDQPRKSPHCSKTTIFTDGNVHSEKNIHKTIILDDSSISDLLCPKQCATVFIEDSLEKEEREISNNNSNIIDNGKMLKKGKKKLMSLRENSQLLSLTPQEQPLPIKSTVIPKIQKRHKNKRVVKKLKTAAEEKIKDNSLLEDYMDVRPARKEKEKKPRKILSKKILIKKRVNHMLSQLDENMQKTSFEKQTNPTSVSKNSMNSFQNEKTIPTQVQKEKSRKIVIVTTGLSKADKNLVQSIVKTLGMARIESHVTRKTTHVVSTGVRTINLLHGIIRGCWLVSLEWVLQSLGSNQWIKPETYELMHFSKAVLENRRDRQLFGDSYVPELFATCGLIHVQNDTTPPCDIIKDLIKTAGGQITEDEQAAKIFIGANGLKESWVLDSITTGELQLYSSYKRESN